MTRWSRKMLKRVCFHLNLYIQPWKGEGSPLSNEHFLEFMGPVKVSFFVWETNWRKVFTLDTLQKRGRPLMNNFFFFGKLEGEVYWSYSTSLHQSKDSMTSLLILIQCSLADHFFSERYPIKLAWFLCGEGKEKDLEKLLLISFFWTI